MAKTMQLRLQKPPIGCDMRCKPTIRVMPAVRRAQAAFTLVEVLAALTLMAIVIPVAVEGLRIAGKAGEVGQRKTAAAHIAERVLNESMVTRQLQGATQNGVVQEGTIQYQWSDRKSTRLNSSHEWISYAVFCLKKKKKKKRRYMQHHVQDK